MARANRTEPAMRALASRITLCNGSQLRRAGSCLHRCSGGQQVVLLQCTHYTLTPSGITTTACKFSCAAKYENERPALPADMVTAPAGVPVAPVAADMCFAKMFTMPLILNEPVFWCVRMFNVQGRGISKRGLLHVPSPAACGCDFSWFGAVEV